MDDILNRQVPQSVEAEQAVLGSILIDPACVPEVIGLLQPADFYNDYNREIFETVYSMFTSSKKIDAVTVLDEMKITGKGGGNDGRAYFIQLMDLTPTAANVQEYCRIVRDKSTLRALLAATDDIVAAIQSGGGDAADVAELAEQKIYGCLLYTSRCV